MDRETRILIKAVAAGKIPDERQAEAIVRQGWRELKKDVLEINTMLADLERTLDTLP